MKKFIAWVVGIMTLFGVGAYYSDKHLSTDILASIGIHLTKKEDDKKPPLVIEKTFSIIFVDKGQPTILSHKENSKIEFLQINNNKFLGWSKTNSVDDLVVDLNNELATKTTVYFAMYQEESPVVEKTHTIVFINKDNAKISDVIENNKIKFENIEDEGFLGWSKSNSADDLIADLNNETATTSTAYFAVYKDAIQTPADNMVVTYIIESDVVSYGSLFLEKNKPISLEEFKAKHSNEILKEYNYIPTHYSAFEEEVVVKDFTIIDMISRQFLDEIDTTQNTLLAGIQPIYTLQNYTNGIIIKLNGEVDKVIKANDSITYDSLGNMLETNYALGQVKDAYYVYNDIEHMSVWDLFNENLTGVNIKSGLHVIDIQLQEESLRVDNIVIKNLLGQDVTIPYNFEAKDSFEIYSEIQYNIVEKFSNIVEFAFNFKIENELFLGYDFNPLFNYKLENFNASDNYDSSTNTAYLNWDYLSAFEELNLGEEYVRVSKIRSHDINGSAFEIPADLKYSTIEDLNTIFQMETKSLTIEDFGKDYGMYYQLFGIDEPKSFVFKNNDMKFYFEFGYDIDTGTITLMWDAEAYLANIERYVITLNLESLNGQAQVSSSSGFYQTFEEPGVYTFETLRITDLRIYILVTAAENFYVSNITTYDFNGDDSLRDNNVNDYYVQYRNFTEDFTIEVHCKDRKEEVEVTLDLSNLNGIAYVDSNGIEDELVFDQNGIYKIKVGLLPFNYAENIRPIFNIRVVPVSGYVIEHVGYRELNGAYLSTINSDAYNYQAMVDWFDLDFELYVISNIEKTTIIEKIIIDTVVYGPNNQNSISTTQKEFEYVSTYEKEFNKFMQSLNNQNLYNFMEQYNYFDILENINDMKWFSLYRGQLSGVIINASYNEEEKTLYINYDTELVATFFLNIVY